MGNRTIILTVAVVMSMLLATPAQGASLAKAKSRTGAEIEQRAMTPENVKCKRAGRKGANKYKCRWSAAKTDGSLCKGQAIVVKKRAAKLRKVRCSLEVTEIGAADAPAVVRSAIADRGQEPGAIACGPAGSGWACDWEAYESIAGWRYSCAGKAEAPSAGGPYTLEPCALQAPELAPLTDAPAAHPTFGFNEQWGYFLDDIVLSKTSGADTARYGLAWRGIEKSPGSYSWGAYDLLYTTLIAAGVKPVISIAGAPCWAAETCDSPYVLVPGSAHDEDWKNFAAAVAKRYPLARAIEIWNEPNLPPYFAGEVDPERYAELLSLAHAGIKAVDPSMPVLAAGLAPVYQDNGGGSGRLTAKTFLRRAYAVGGIKNSSDGVAYHAYPAVGPEADYLGAIRRQLANVRQAMVEAGDAAKPLWITETGVTTAHGYTPQQQAEASAAIYEQYRRIPGVASVIFHRWADNSANAWEAGTGMVSLAGEPKPVLCALANARGGSCVRP